MNINTIIYELATASIAAPMLEVETRKLMHAAELAKATWEGAGSPGSGPEHDACDEANERFHASLVTYVQALRLRESALKRLSRCKR
jgi:hypothetical protein